MGDFSNEGDESDGERQAYRTMDLDKARARLDDRRAVGDPDDGLSESDAPPSQGDPPSVRILDEDFYEVGPLEAVAELYEALARAQATFEPIVKNRTAVIRPRDKPEYRFDFADLEAVIAATRPSLTREGIAVLAPPSHNPGESGALVTLRLMLAKGRARIVVVTRFYYEGDIKAYGAAVTYHRRYVLNGTLNLSADADADDGPSDREQSGSSGPRQPAAPAQRPAARPASSPPPPPPPTDADPQGPPSQATMAAMRDAYRANGWTFQRGGEEYRKAMGHASLQATEGSCRAFLAKLRAKQ